MHVETRSEWRSWLAEHHVRETEIWLVYNRKRSGLPSVSYDEAVEEALCFGIDGIVKPIDDDRYAQRRLSEAISLLARGQKPGLK